MELLTSVILKSLVSVERLAVWVGEIAVVVSLHASLVLELLSYSLVLHVVLSMPVHLDVLVLLHLHLLLVGVGMHSLGRVKTSGMDLLVELVHLHLVIHVQVRLGLHLLPREVHTHLLAGHVLLLHLVLLSVVDALLLVLLHLFNCILILPINLVISMII